MSPNDKLKVIRERCIAANTEKFNGWPCDHCHSNLTIRLADVLLAIDSLADQPDIEILSGYLIFWPQPSEVRWNLRADDLTLQSPETIQFLYDLLN